jgi:hypothetical protein
MYKLDLIRAVQKVKFSNIPIATISNGQVDSYFMTFGELAAKNGFKHECHEVVT